MVPSGQRRFRLRGMEIQYPQWEALRVLEPGWMLVRRDWATPRTRGSLTKNGWVEIRDKGAYLMVRLTPKGLELRNAVWVYLAEKLDRCMVYFGTFRGQRLYDGYNYGPRSPYSRPRRRHSAPGDPDIRGGGMEE